MGTLEVLRGVVAGNVVAEGSPVTKVSIVAANFFLLEVKVVIVKMVV